jgi:hypothetical protein
MNASLETVPGLWEFLTTYDGTEGDVGASFIALWPIDQIGAWNDLLEVPTFAPDLTIFATDGGEEAYGVSRASDTPRIVNVPLVGLGDVEARDVAGELAGFLDWLGGSAIDPLPDDSPLKGKMIWRINPIIFGGDPTDRDNMRFVHPTQALKMAAWFNHRLREARAPRDIAAR